MSTLTFDDLAVGMPVKYGYGGPDPIVWMTFDVGRVEGKGPDWVVVRFDDGRAQTFQSYETWESVEGYGEG